MRHARLSRLTVGLYALLLAVLLLLGGTLIASRAPWYHLFGWSVHSIVRLRQLADSWRPMREAVEFARANPNGELYEEIFFRRHIKFQYPPSSLILIDGLSPQALKWISVVLLGVNVLAICAILERSLRRYGHPAAYGDRFDALARIMAVAALALLFYPINVAFALGQIQCWVNAAFAVAVYCWLGRRDATAGGVLGLLTWVKPNYALFLLWGALRGHMRLALAGGGVAALGAIAGALRFGWREEIAYVRVLRTLARHGEGFYPNQSINGTLQRLMGNADPLHFERAAFPPYNPTIFVVTTVAMVVLTIAALWLPGRWRQGGTAADLALFTIVITITAPIAWEHHYGMLPPVIAAALVPLMQRGAMGRTTIPLLSAAWLLMTAHIVPLVNVSTPGWNIVESYMFFGAILLAGVLLVHIWTGRAPVEDGKVGSFPEEQRGS